MQICFCVSTIWYGISYSGRLSKSSGTEHDQTGPAHTIYESIVGIWLACSGTLGPYIRLVQQYKVLIDAALVLFRHWSLHAWGHESSYPCRARIAILLSDRWIKQTCPEHYFGCFHFCDGVYKHFFGRLEPRLCLVNWKIPGSKMFHMKKRDYQTLPSGCAEKLSMSLCSKLCSNPKHGHKKSREYSYLLLFRTLKNLRIMIIT